MRRYINSFSPQDRDLLGREGRGRGLSLLAAFSKKMRQDEEH